MNPFQYFTDAVLRGPTIGCMLMCLAASLIGVLIFLRKQSLLGESLSHAAYPGVVAGIIIAAALSIDENNDKWIAFLILTGAFASSLLGLLSIHLLHNKLKIRIDSALCFVLAAFFGIGITLASHVQFTHAVLYRQIQSYLYGQAATMTDIHILIYGVLSFFVAACIFAFYKELQTITFNREFAFSMGMHIKSIDLLVFVLTVLSVVIGIRSVGVVLMSAMLIAPAVAARQYTNNLYIMLFLSGLFGMFSGYLGNYLSVELSRLLSTQYPMTRLSFPTGPMIVVSASLICFLSLLFAPERGLLLRFVRAACFRYQCVRENLLKVFWRLGVHQDVSFEKIAKSQDISRLYLRFILFGLSKNGWLNKTGPHTYCLTIDGEQWAAHIVRLHRLWEVYLADYLGVGAERVHCNAEEIEHILTPELEKELTILLKDPQIDPHHQQIPRKM